MDIFLIPGKNGKVPTRAEEGAAGYDLYAATDRVVRPTCVGPTIIDTGIKLSIPDGHYGRIAPRSGLAARHSLDVGAGVIDSSYNGEIKVVIFNLSDIDYHVKKGDRVAQLIIEKISTPVLRLVESEDEWNELYNSKKFKRGENGFGSTGVK